MKKLTLLLSLIIFVAIAVISYLATTVAQPGPDAPSGMKVVIRGAVFYRADPPACDNNDPDCEHRIEDKFWLYSLATGDRVGVSYPFYLPNPDNPYTWEFTIEIPSEEALPGMYRTVADFQLASGPNSVAPNPFDFYFNGGAVPVEKFYCVNYCVKQ